MTNRVEENAVGAFCSNVCMPVAITSEIMTIFEYLSENDKIVFKSQQIDEPELNNNEKKLIALEIFNKSHKTFLMRFGKYLETKHVDDLKTFCLKGCDYDEDIDSILLELQKNLEKRKSNVKNRRYAAMKELMKEDEYFSEREMMKREPHLYEHLIGQYLTKSEKNIRDGFDPKTTPFSSVLMNNLENDRIEELRKEQKREEGIDENSQLTDFSSTKTEYDDSTVENEELFPTVPPEYRKHWGSFDDNEKNSQQYEDFNLAGTSSCKKRNKIKCDDKFITASEREMLRQEFMGIMYSKFIDGHDKDFDYSGIDDDSNLDDLKQINQDMEDEYFKDDDEMNTDIKVTNNEKMDETVMCESDDDLDVYMNHLNKHHSIQN